MDQLGLFGALLGPARPEDQAAPGNVWVEEHWRRQQDGTRVLVRAHWRRRRGVP